MTQKLKISLSALAAALLLSNCQEAPDTAIQQIKNASASEVVGTIEMEAPARIVKAGFAPDDFAKWKSEILLLSETGALYRTTANDTKISAIEGEFTDISGLSLGGNQVGFLGLKPDGQMVTFKRNNETGNFSKTIFTAPDQAYRQFCAGSPGESQMLWAMRDDRTLDALALEVSKTGHIELSIENTVKAPFKTSHCATSYDGQLSVQDAKTGNIRLRDGDKWSALTRSAQIGPYSWLSGAQDKAVLTSAAQMGNLSRHGEDAVHTVTIIDGLGISGMERPGLAVATTVNLGSTFADGAVLVADDESGRVILIAKPYFVQVTTGSAN